MNAQATTLSFLTPSTKPTLIRNEKLPNTPLITPFMDAAGNVKTDLQGNPIGYLTVSQEMPTLNGGFLNIGTRYAYISSTIANLEKVITQNKWQHGSEVPGKIIVTESLQPFYEGQKGKINPTTKDPVLVSANGNNYPVFYQANWTDNMNAVDYKIRTTEDAMAWLNARAMDRAVAQATATVSETSGVPSTETVGA